VTPPGVQLRKFPGSIRHGVRLSAWRIRPGPRRRRRPHSVLVSCERRFGRRKPGSGQFVLPLGVASSRQHWFAVSARCPRQDSNLRFRLRRSALYPLSYEGGLPSLLLAITGLCLSMAIGAEQAEIREFVIQSVSVDVIEFQRERAAVP
jgi:hypothetical protein